MEELDVGEVVTPGFRFYPTEEELITFYLKHKLIQQQQQAEAAAGGSTNNTSSSRLMEDIDRVIPQLHVYDFYPWDLPQYAGERCQGDPEQWFFFIPRQEKEARGGRPSRLTSSGYWKATGSPSIVYSSGNRAIGIKRTMVFYNGRAPTGTKTKWKMNEYKAFAFAFALLAFQQQHQLTNPKPQLMGELSLCRVYVKSNCLRAFDRRPPSGVRIISAQPPVAQPPVYNTSTTMTTTHPSILLENTSSSSLSDHSHYSSSDDQTVNHSHSTIDTHDQPLWDWEELKKWF